MEKKFNVTFNELSESKQRQELDFDSGELSEELLKLGAKSQYENIRLLVIDYSGTSSSMLSEILKEEKSTDIIIAIWEKPNFEKNRENLQILSVSPNPKIRSLVAKYEGTPSDMLDTMLEKEYDDEVIYTIWYNPNFIKTDKNLQILSKSSNWDFRLMVAEYEGTPSDMLDSMLEQENYDNVIASILNNSNFKKNDKKLEKLSKTDDLDIRYWIAEYEETPSYILDTMLKEEGNKIVFRTIIKNPNFRKNIKNNLIIMKKKLLLILLDRISITDSKNSEG